MFEVVRLLCVLGSVLLLPGWALLALSGVWRERPGVLRLIIAIGLSIAFYPVLFYGLRFIAPFATLGPYKMGAFLLLCAMIVVWRTWSSGHSATRYGPLEWCALFIFGLTLFTRFWVAVQYPYPAWTDSLHHTLLTWLTAEHGQLPTTLNPYFPIPLQMYHLGLYALSATVEWLAQVPPHTALLWTAQALNGLCGLGVYLLLYEPVGPLGALAGAATVGLLSHQPAFYVNWGRFTQIAAQTILFIALFVTVDTIKVWPRLWSQARGQSLWRVLFSAMLGASVFLLHFRVAAFYILLLAPTLLVVLWRRKDGSQFRSMLASMIVIGVISLTLISPVLWPALQAYLHPYLAPATPQAAKILLDKTQQGELTQIHFSSPWSTIPDLAAHSWLLAWVAIATLFGLIRRNRWVWLSVVWLGLLFLLGNLYLLGIGVLDVTNLGAILIMWYLPFGLIVGAATAEFVNLWKTSWRPLATWAVAATLLVACLPAAYLRVTDIEPYRYFVTAPDVAAMDWIKANVPENARFAVNSAFWSPIFPHGTDAGYWIPYFTGRQTTAGSMLSPLAPAGHLVEVVKLSRLVKQLETDPSVTAQLLAAGVGYIYIGKRGNFAGPGLNAGALSQAANLVSIYRKGGVSIFKILPPQSRN